ncbi:MAG: DUF4291 domain-containing protein [Myxococcota bacterium]
METAPYLTLRETWPTEGRVILARYNADTIVVYQAFRAEIADAAVAAQRFVPPFSLDRTSWIKPGFLWMMHRSSWATAPGQERVLAITVARAGFEAILAAAVPSSAPRDGTPHAEWHRAVRRSDVVVQWDPDHGPGGEKLARRVIQLGLRREMLRRYVEDWTVRIEDLTPFVASQRGAWARDRASLQVPIERPWP